MFIQQKLFYGFPNQNNKKKILWKILTNYSELSYKEKENYVW